MPTERKIGAAYIEVLSKGLAKVQSDLNKLQQDLKKAGGASDQASKSTKELGNAASHAAGMFTNLAGKIQAIGGIAQKSFFAATASIMGLIRAADPVGVQRFGGTLGAISVQIGSIFIPLLDTASKYLQQLLDWLRSLTDEQKDQILHWVKIGLGIAAVIAVIPKLVAGFRMLQAAMALFGAESAFATGGLTVLLGAIAVAIPALISLFGSMKGGGAGGVFSKVSKALSGLVAVFESVFSKLADYASQILEQLTPVFNAIAGAIEEVIKAVLPFVGELFRYFEEVASKVIPIYARVFGAVAKVFSLLTQAFARVAPTIQKLFSSILEAYKSFILPVIDTIGQVVDAIMTDFVPMVEEMIEELTPVVNDLVDYFRQIIEAAQPIIDVFTEIVMFCLRLLVPTFKFLAGMTLATVKGFRFLMDAMKPVILYFINDFKKALEMIATVIEFVCNAMIDAVNGLIRALNSIIAKIPGVGYIGGSKDFQLEHISLERRKKENEERKEREKTEERELKAKKLPDKKEKGRHTPTAQQKADIIGVAEAWKKAQTAVNGAENSAEKERNRLLEEANKKHEEGNDWLRRIFDAMKDGEGPGLGP
jgi:phage-related protein